MNHLRTQTRTHKWSGGTPQHCRTKTTEHNKQCATPGATKPLPPQLQAAAQQQTRLQAPQCYRHAVAGGGGGAKRDRRGHRPGHGAGTAGMGGGGDAANGQPEARGIKEDRMEGGFGDSIDKCTLISEIALHVPHSTAEPLSLRAAAATNIVYRRKGLMTIPSTLYIFAVTLCVTSFKSARVLGTARCPTVSKSV